ncbi:transposase [Streptomyces sp. NA02950]|uniref:IS701 family transposase n=1 Tax=Streptomyces sp. NA02950 TaxID=2742137 RepID=UPI0015928DF7|nr:transposase [Streptomyces sp. NA02950]QKV96998.1 transposase [Streptomyces sp. NA02950]
MSGVALSTEDLSGDAKAWRPPGIGDVVLDELCSTLFASLPRRDQRRRAAEYVRGLLGTEGRKSVRNIAALIGGQATEQSLHHFVSSSTWDWTPVRRALAQYLVRAAPPQAWVVRPMVIPKAGENSVGVDRRFFPALGQSLNAQQAVGVWAASMARSDPVNWRLQLSDAWLADLTRRSRASIPDELVPESLEDCAVEAYLGMTRSWDLPVRPVVLDAREAGAVSAVRRFRAAHVPLLVRINSSVRLRMTDPALPDRDEALSAHQIMNLAGNRRRPVPWHGLGRPAEAVHTVLAATARVTMASHPGRLGRGAAREELLLLGTGEHGCPWPAELWLTDLMHASPADLLRLTTLVHRVDRDFAEISDRVGMRDYTGRSYIGWHRHVTLASAAHAIATLTGTTQRHACC